MQFLKHTLFLIFHPHNSMSSSFAPECLRLVTQPGFKNIFAKKWTSYTVGLDFLIVWSSLDSNITEYSAKLWDSISLGNLHWLTWHEWGCLLISSLKLALRAPKTTWCVMRFLSLSWQKKLVILWMSMLRTFK